jgi:hypothetical protein
LYRQLHRNGPANLNGAALDPVAMDMTGSTRPSLKPDIDRTPS